MTGLLAFLTLLLITYVAQGQVTDVHWSACNSDSFGGGFCRCGQEYSCRGGCCEGMVGCSDCINIFSSHDGERYSRCWKCGDYEYCGATESTPCLKTVPIVYGVLGLIVGICCCLCLICILLVCYARRRLRKPRSGPTVEPVQGEEGGTNNGRAVRSHQRTRQRRHESIFQMSRAPVPGIPINWATDAVQSEASPGTSNPPSPSPSRLSSQGSMDLILNSQRLLELPLISETDSIQIEYEGMELPKTSPKSNASPSHSSNPPLGAVVGTVESKAESLSVMGTVESKADSLTEPNRRPVAIILQPGLEYTYPDTWTGYGYAPHGSVPSERNPTPAPTPRSSINGNLQPTSPRPDVGVLATVVRP